MEKVNVGVIGLGRAGEKHAHIYNRLPNVNLVAVCDKNEKLLDKYSKLFGAKGTTNFEDILKDPEIDAVSIVMPDTLHKEVTELALANGKHILLEKPIASTIEDGLEIAKMAEKSNTVFMVAHILRFMTAHSIAREKIRNGQLGDLLHIYGRRNSTIAGAQQYSSHKTDTHIHLMVHDIEYINWITNSLPKTVYAKARQNKLKSIGMRDSILALLEYQNGVIVSLEACWVLPANSPFELDDKMEIVGTEGVIYLDGICRGLEFVGSTKNSIPDTVAWPLLNGEITGSIFEEVFSFIDCIVNNKKPLIGAKEALEALFVADAIDESINTGREIVINWDSVQLVEEVK